MSYSGLGFVGGSVFDMAGHYAADGRRCATTPSAFAAAPKGRSAGCTTTLPSSESERERVCYFMPNDHGQPWMMLGVRSSQANRLRDALRYLGFGVGIEPGGRAQRNVGLAGAVEQAWYRLGAPDAWWVYHLTDNTDAGVTWDWGRFVRIHPDMWDRIFDAARGVKAPWVPLSDRFVRVQGGAPEDRRDNLIDRVAKRLMNGGLMPEGPVTGTVMTTTGSNFVGGDGGAFISGLRKLWQMAGADPKKWPSGINFGPTTRAFGDPGNPMNQLRIHPDLLNFLHCNLLPGEARQIPVMAVRKVVGTLPKVR